MKGLKLEIKTRNRIYGILTWKVSQNLEIKKLLSNSNFVKIEFANKLYPERKVDYKYRRISFGKKRMEEIFKNYVTLTVVNGNLVIK